MHISLCILEFCSPNGIYCSMNFELFELFRLKTFRKLSIILAHFFWGFYILRAFTRNKIALNTILLRIDNIYPAIVIQLPWNRCFWYRSHLNLDLENLNSQMLWIRQFTGTTIKLSMNAILSSYDFYQYNYSSPKLKSTGNYITFSWKKYDFIFRIKCIFSEKPITMKVFQMAYL